MVYVVAATVVATALLGFATMIPEASLQESESLVLGPVPEEAYALEVEGKSKSSSSSSKMTTSCEDGAYSKRTLKIAYELPFPSLFEDSKGQSKYEASSVIIMGTDAYAVCDNSWAISRFAKKLQPFSPSNVQLGNPSGEEGVPDSGFEAIFHDGDSFYVVRESVEHEDGHYHAVILQVKVGATDYQVIETCSTDYRFEGTSKGFEGAIGIRDLNDELVVLGLCEGNHCSESRKFDRGNGRLVALRKVLHDDGSCEWTALRTINVPPSAYFHDYSDLAMDGKGRVAITTQEDSQLWVGQMLGQDPVTGLWDVNAMEFDLDTGSTYDFPKNDRCETIYCNIEGIEWLNDEMIVAVSDKMKGKGKQDFLCFDKDQSVHVFVLP